MKVRRAALVAGLMLVAVLALVPVVAALPDPGKDANTATVAQNGRGFDMPNEYPTSQDGRGFDMPSEFPTSPATVPEPAPTPTAAPGTTGTDWTALLIGVGIGAASVLVIEGAVHVVRHPPRGHRPVATH